MPFMLLYIREQIDSESYWPHISSCQDILSFSDMELSILSLEFSYYVPCLKPLAFPYAETVFAIAIFSSSDSLAPLFIEFIEISPKELGLGDGA